MLVKDICSCIEEFAPLSFQESWDNSGLIVGSPHQAVHQALITIDVTEDVVKEAIESQSQMIIAHHPVVLSGIRQLTGTSDSQRAVMLAVRNDIAIYAAHTNLDIARGGVSYRMAKKLELANIQILLPQGPGLCKLVTFIPKEYFVRVSDAVFKAGAGHTGNYDLCGYSVEGQGTFRALENARPFAGLTGQRHTEPEIRFETVFPAHLGKQIIAALLENHPYEEVAYDIYALQNTYSQTGTGVTGILPVPVDERTFLQKLKETFSGQVIRHTDFHDRPVQTVALCGGSGSSLLNDAIRSKADVFVTADFKYHQFADAGQDIFIADIGHFESEQFAKEIFHEILKKKFPNFATHFSKIKTNPINYYL